MHNVIMHERAHKVRNTYGRKVRKMRKTRKWFNRIIAASLAIAMLTGCGSSSMDTAEYGNRIIRLDSGKLVG